MFMQSYSEMLMRTASYFKSSKTLVLRKEYVSLSDGPHGVTVRRPYGLFSSLGKCLPHVYSARLLGISTQPACLTCHPLILLTTILRDREVWRWFIQSTRIRLYHCVLSATISCPSWLHVLCSIDSPFYIVAAIYSKLSILLLISQIRLALRLLTSEHCVTNAVFCFLLSGDT